MRDEVVAERVGDAVDARLIGFGVLDGEVIFRGEPAAHAFLADEQVLDVDAGHVVAAGREFDRVARLDLRERVVERAAGMVVAVAVAFVMARGCDEPGTHGIGMRLHAGSRQKANQHQEQGIW